MLYGERSPNWLFQCFDIVRYGKINLRDIYFFANSKSDITNSDDNSFDGISSF